MEEEWSTISEKLKSYIEHPELHPKEVFLTEKEELFPETIDRLREEKGLRVDGGFAGFYRVRRTIGHPGDLLAKPV